MTSNFSRNAVALHVSSNVNWIVIFLYFICEWVYAVAVVSCYSNMFIRECHIFSISRIDTQCLRNEFNFDQKISIKWESDEKMHCHQKLVIGFWRIFFVSTFGGMSHEYTLSVPLCFCDQKSVPFNLNSIECTHNIGFHSIKNSTMILFFHWIPAQFTCVFMHALYDFILLTLSLFLLSLLFGMCMQFPTSLLLMKTFLHFFPWPKQLPANELSRSGWNFSLVCVYFRHAYTHTHTHAHLHRFSFSIYRIVNLCMVSNVRWPMFRELEIDWRRKNYQPITIGTLHWQNEGKKCQLSFLAYRNVLVVFVILLILPASFGGLAGPWSKFAF